ncbi:MAG: GntR family transcriptional regulator [Prevotella sp.]|nr:GntR family transcriptional regulator [Prevotella sp.]
MNFKPNRPIYLQIVDFCFRNILTNEWAKDNRIPSVRELGLTLQVNPNTAMRAFEYMQAEDIIYLKRGMGYYVSPEARKKISILQKKEFFDEILPVTFESMNLLDISIEEVVKHYEQYKEKQQ